MKRIFPALFLATILSGTLSGSPDFFEMPPIHYSKTASDDAIARMERELAAGEWAIPPGNGKEFLRVILDRLNVPVESQVLVFSKTSLQIGLIHHKNPRALYFSNDVYVGWVPGGKVEVIVEDEKLGPVFYILTPPIGGKPARFKRETDSCLQCHANSRTEGVPGMFIRSVIPDENSHAILSHGTTLVDDSTPIRERWGGWYVTGTSDEPHLGNRRTTEEVGLKPEHQNLDHLSGQFDTSKYLMPTSDIVALMVLEHQCRIHNLLTKAKFGYQRALWYQQSLQKELSLEDPTGMSTKNAEQSATEITEALLFKDEATMKGDGVEGSEAFLEAFLKRGVTPKSGRGLRSLKLYKKLFKYRCSYMIYSKAFRTLPAFVKERVFVKLRAALSEEGSPKFAYLSSREKKKIRTILKETVSEF